jgi:UPF0042 nucleotide-binding protein
MQIFIISGLSGAGKSRAANILEDIGYYCVDNLPVALLPKFAEFCISMSGKYEKVALVTDIRSGDSFAPLSKLWTPLEKWAVKAGLFSSKLMWRQLYGDTRRAAGDIPLPRR